MRSDWLFVVAAVCMLLAGGPASAQTPSTPTARASFLSRADFSFGWSRLGTPDQRFDWLGRAAIDFDIVDYGRGRVAFRVDYEATIGRERRRYDLNQGFYYFETTASVRRADVEAQFLVQHVSRHLVDREEPRAISWNVFGGRVRHRWSLPRARLIESEIEAGRFTQPAFVDYRWMGRARLAATAPVGGRLSILARAAGEVIGVDRRVADRGQTCGGLVEAGVRIAGRVAAIELFAGYERRVDAFPIDRARVRWFTAGFRVVSR